jgi:ankyrin repeat protein
LNITKQSTPLSNKPKQYSSSKVVAEYSKLSAALPSNDPLDTPLHVACTIGGFSENFIIHHILKSNPQYASRKNSNGNLPLHCAILNPNGLTLKLMDSLLASYPSSVYELNSESCLPIHLLCQRRTYDIEVLKRLLELHPSSVTMQCKLSIGTSNKNIQKAEYTPQDEDLTDYYYCFGLIYNKGNKNPTSKTQISPNDEYRSSETDFSPLHLACLNGAPTEVINLIISTNILCLSVKTSLGRTALDCVKAYGESLKETQPNKNDS